MLMGRYVIADIEATGLGPERQMIEIALITIDDGKIVDVYETLLNPLIPLPKHIYDLTLISPRELEVAPKFYEVAEQIERRLRGSVFVSHNVAFDWAMLESAFHLMGEEIRLKTLCTLQMSQDLIPGLKGYSLEEMAKFFRIKLQVRHRALPDARACLDLFRELMELKTDTRPDRPLIFLPQHESFLKEIPHQAGILKLKDENGKILRIETCHDLHSTLTLILSVAPKNRELLETCMTVDWEVTGTALIAAFRCAKKKSPRWRWMITVGTNENGQLFFQKEAFRPDGRGKWFFQGHREAQDKFRDLNTQLPKQRFAWREGGPSKEEILEHNKEIERLLKETRFPSENLLLWGPGRTPGEWAYVLVRQGNLIGWGFDKRSPELVLEKPDSVVRTRYGKIPTEKLLAIRYLQEHRENRFKKDQWRELKEIEC